MACWRVGEKRHAEVDQLRAAVGGGPVEAGERGHSGVEADLESFDLAEPAVGAGLGDALTEVADDLDEAGPLLRVELEHRATDAGLSELAQLAARWDGSPASY